MDHFNRKDDGALYCEGVPLADIAARFGTPTYVYSRATLTRHVEVLARGVSGVPHHLCYAVKANGNIALLQVLAKLGCEFDAVSVGELARILAAGVEASRVIVSGVGKRDDEIEAALRAGVRYLSIESKEELLAVARVAQALGTVAQVSVRVNPDVDAKTHPYIATGMKENKFGVPKDEALELYRLGLGLPSIALCGVTCHIGSQVTDLAPFRDAALRMRELATALQQMGVPLRYVGMGGGLGIPYAGETPPPPDVYGQVLTEVLGPLGLTLVLEPGRVIVGNAGILLTRVVRKKETSARNFVIVDAGMNDLIRPALYDAFHGIEPVAAPRSESTSVDVVGPVCESADSFAHARILPKVEPNELLAIRSAGAYGFVMASTYNGRPRPAEVLVDGDQALLVRARESLADLWRGEVGLDGAAIPVTHSS